MTARRKKVQAAVLAFDATVFFVAFIAHLLLDEPVFAAVSYAVTVGFSVAATCFWLESKS